MTRGTATHEDGREGSNLEGLLWTVGAVQFVAALTVYEGAVVYGLLLGAVLTSAMIVAWAAEVAESRFESLVAAIAIAGAWMAVERVADGFLAGLPQRTRLAVAGLAGAVLVGLALVVASSTDRGSTTLTWMS